MSFRFVSFNSKVSIQQQQQQQEAITHKVYYLTSDPLFIIVMSIKL